MTIMTYGFMLCVYRDGTRIPAMKVMPDKYRPLAELGMHRLSVASNVEAEVARLVAVVAGDGDAYELSTYDWCIVDVGPEVSVVRNGFDEFEPFEMPTAEILKLLRDWADFLRAYERGEIPGITYQRPPGSGGAGPEARGSA